MIAQAQITHGLQARGIGMPDAGKAAYETLERIIGAQAAALAFGDCYRAIFLVFLVLSPFVFLLRRPTPPPA